MRPTIKTIRADGMPGDLHSWHLFDTSHDAHYLEIVVSYGGARLETAFFLLLATPEGLRRAYTMGDKVVLWHGPIMVVDRMDYPTILQEIKRRFEECIEPGWNQTLAKLRRAFRWEEEYSPRA